MSRVAPIVPAESDILCEGCGYTLNGLPEDGRCPECGKPVAESRDAARAAPAWEHPEVHRPAAFVSTTAAVIFRPTQFYRTLATRLRTEPAKDFARWHWLIAAALFTLSAYIHSWWEFGSLYPRGALPAWVQWPIFIGLGIAVYLALFGVTKLAAFLTNWEASYRGLRLPINVVLRGMYYHAAHYLPVALMALTTVVVYRLLYRFHVLQLTWTMTQGYLYLLSAEVIIGAIYLFQTYWIGMRNMMYANR
jgi:hypothetical protein